MSAVLPEAVDYLIVGGGSAGCVLAARLSEDPQVQVALLEAGPADGSVLVHCPAGLAVLALTGQANWGFQTEPQRGLNGRSGYQPRGKVLGGSSSINAMIYTRGHRSDYDAWASEGNAGWGWQDVLPYFRKAEGNERGADAYHGADGPLHVMDLPSPHRFGPVFVQAARQAGQRENPDFNGAEQEGVGLYQVTHQAGERCSAAKAYLARTARGPTCTSSPAPMPPASCWTAAARRVSPIATMAGTSCCTCGPRCCFARARCCPRNC
jgi:choline dehydrogenase-like flavoprotein